GGKRTHVGVPDEQMKAPIFSVIGQWLIARINNGAIKLHPLIDVVHDVIGALTQLKIDLRLWLRRLEVECERIGLADTTGAGKDLSGRQESEQRTQDRRRKLGFPFHQIIFMAT